MIPGRLRNIHSEIPHQPADELDPTLVEPSTDFDQEPWDIGLWRLH
ncbi:MAG: hypothetical protein P1U34_04220 [Coxiellaceae bacterium]|nr:hypothetical protein [Coxiellaceae bacterium]